MRRNPWRKKGALEKNRSQRGIALFMVMGAITLLTVLMAELTYSTQVHSRLAYNYVDGLKAYYLAKAALKLSELRLRSYLQIKNFLNDPNNKQIKETLPKGTIDKIWSMPLLFPIPVPTQASMAEADMVKDFMKESRLSGSYTANITGESTKLNLNMLFVKTASADQASGASGASGTQPNTPSSGSSGSSPAGASGSSAATVNFRPLLESTISSLIEQKKTQDNEFADVYRNLQGKDVVDAIEYYLFPEKPVSNLPGFKAFKAKQAPFFSITELHLIPGIDDEIYSLLEPSFTVYSTPGVNMNTIDKRMLRALIPELNETEADDVLRKRDDPDVGQPWATEEDFFKAVSETGAGQSINEIKKRLKDANIKFTADENSFKVSVLATVGQAQRRLEAYIVLDANAVKQNQPGQPGQPSSQNPQGGPTPGSSLPGQANGQQQEGSAKKPTGVNLIYWRML